MSSLVQSGTEVLKSASTGVAETSVSPRLQPILPRASSGPWQLSFAQERIWFLHHFAAGIPVYSVPIAVRLQGRLDVKAFEQALSALSARHETLRTVFASLDGTPAQTVLPSKAAELPVISLEGFAEEEKQTRLESSILEFIRKPFDLEREFPLCACLIRSNEQDHTLVLNLHHICADGWSMGILHQELAALYQAFCDGDPLELPELPVQYADFAEWQRKWLTDQALDGQLSYWRKQLDGAPPYLELRTDLPRPAAQTYNGARHFFQMPVALAVALREFSARQGVSLFMTLLAGFEVLLHRYTAQEEIVVGTPIASRPRPEIEGLIGFFLNTLALRVDLTGDPSFRELLARVRKVTLDAYGNSDLPFERLLEELKPERDLSRNPVFQVMFTLQSSPTANIQLRQLSLSSRELDTGTSKFDLFVVLQEKGRELGGYVEYNTDLFQLPTIQRMLSHFEHLLAGAVQNGEEKISRLPLLGAPERRQLVTGWNDTHCEYPGQAIHQLFEIQVERTPDRVALTCGDEQLSYRELNQRANQLARRLKEIGVGPDVLVGIFLERSFEMVVGLLGILKAGGAYVPLDPAYPRNWLAFLLQDSNASVLLTQERLLKNMPVHAAEVICLDRDWREIARNEAANLVGGGTIDALAYVIYTSGSTGEPKGVLAPHRGAVNRFAWMWRKYPFAGDEVCCQKTSLNFVDSVWEIFGPLLQGVPAVLIPDEVLKNPLELVQVLSHRRVSRIVVVPSLLDLLLEAYEQESVSHKPRLWISSGETLTAELCQKFHELLPESTLLNLYGSAEIAADATWHECDRLDGKSPSVPIGCPIANTQAHILDAHLEVVPVGVEGEIYLGGDGLARGYHGRPDLTAERFVPNPLPEYPATRLYRTGDLGFRGSDGQIKYVGRADHQVKIRGSRVELEQIEAALRKHPGLKTAVAALQDGGNGEKYLAAYVVPQRAEGVTEAELGKFLKQSVPDYMMPARFVFLSGLPLMPNGKVNRRDLPRPEGQALADQSLIVPPKDEIEAELVEIWQSILDRHPLGVRQNFFDCGGHSLLVSRLLLRIDKAFGKKLSLADVFRAPTVEQLAEILRGHKAASRNPGVVPIQPKGTRPPLFWVRGGPLFRSVAPRFGPDQPFLGLDLPPALIEQLSVPYQFEEIAAAFVKVVRQAHPHGPYFLAGLCVDGVIAYEMARQLTLEGERVAWVALFDAQNPTTYWDYSGDGRLGYLLKKGKFHLGKLRNLRLGQFSDFTRERLQGIVRRLNRMKWYLSYRARRSSGHVSLQDLDAIIHPAAVRYRPQPYSGRLILFQSTDWPEGKYWDYEAGWRNLAAGGIEVHRIPCDHLGMFEEPNVATVVSNLETSLSEVTGVAA
jgi:amino acid adenylation domain-containing protein